MACLLPLRVIGVQHIETKTLTLRRLTLRRLRRFLGLFPPERHARRWAMVLQTYDGVRAGARHRDIAAALFGEKVVREDWSADQIICVCGCNG
jgi:hypothetical protein